MCSLAGTRGLRLLCDCSTKRLHTILAAALLRPSLIIASLPLRMKEGRKMFAEWNRFERYCKVTKHHLCRLLWNIFLNSLQLQGNFTCKTYFKHLNGEKVKWDNVYYNKYYYRLLYYSSAGSELRFRCHLGYPCSYPKWDYRKCYLLDKTV